MATESAARIDPRRYTNEETGEPSMGMLIDELDEMCANNAPRGEKADLLTDFIIALMWRGGYKFFREQAL